MLQIPVKDASTHDAAIVLGAELDAGKYMYTDLQRTYISASETPNYHPTTTSQNGKTGAMKPSDYDHISCLLYTSPSPRDATLSRMPSSA